MRSTSRRRRSENTNNARRYNGGKEGTGRVVEGGYVARRLDVCPVGKVKCPTCNRCIRVRGDGRLFNHNHCPHGGPESPIVVRRETITKFGSSGAALEWTEHDEPLRPDEQTCPYPETPEEHADPHRRRS